MEDAMETVDSTIDSSVPLMISNSKLLDCCICFQPLTIPVFQRPYLYQLYCYNVERTSRNPPLCT
ncbi:hypothetical protein TSUD_211740 [Trifolium subterraneum]|uniref:Uncharacterized protein n=1 Tax=Trifolium subterraneum TaxID=3900 RepID=A0A2Z6NKL3_TRISU|nr:hypothetical protein TSUD_211740 [Trifolium subterraneum]